MKSKITLILAAVGLSALASANIATFDSFTEGALDYVVSDGGISLSDLHLNLPGSPDPNRFVCEDASTGGLGSGFSGPNCLAFVGYVPGTDCAFGRVHSFQMALDSGMANFGSLEFWTFDFWGGVTVSLTAYEGNTVVATDSFSVVTNIISHQTLTVSGDPFSRMELLVSGGQNQDCTFALVDNVVMNPVPEPSVLAALGVGCVAILGIRCRRR